MDILIIVTIRFAPSPTGDFHVGNLRTAWISREWARRLNLPWVVRFENIDGPRNVPGAMEGQLADMKALGLVPDVIQIQNERIERHGSVFSAFFEAGLVYPCVCSRKSIREAVDGASSAPHQRVPGYTGHCRHLKNIPKTSLPTWAWRVRNRNEGGQDDFVVGRTAPAFGAGGKPDRASFAPAYHLACAIDDYDDDHALLVRAWDLEDAAAQQRWIHSCLAELEKKQKPFPAIFHCTLVTADDGNRLEKRTRGASLQEIFETGETGQGLVEKMGQSFRGDWKDFAPEKVFGESAKTLRIGDLLAD